MSLVVYRISFEKNDWQIRYFFVKFSNNIEILGWGGTGTPQEFDYFIGKGILG